MHDAPAPESPRDALRTRLVLAALLLLAVVVYLPGLGGPLLLDDRPNLAPLAAVGTGQLSAWDFIMDDRALFRPLSRASFLLDWWLWGDDVRAFKAVNLALHLLGAVLVFALTRALFRLREPVTTATAVALTVCALWLLAPLLVSTVLYTVQRMAQLAALFSLAGLLCYVHGRRRGAWGPVIATFVVFWPLAALSKENGALLPLLAALVEWWWMPADAMAARVRRLLVALVAIPATLGIGRLLLDPGWLLTGYQGRDFTLVERLLTQPRVLMDYLGNLLLVPGASPLGVLRDDVRASTGLLDPPVTALAALGLAALLGLALASRRTRFAPAGFGLLFFLAAHALESGVFALELYFEHRNYLPAFGVYVAIGAAVAAARTAAPRGVLAASVIVIAMFAALTAQRAATWGSETLLYAQATENHPGSSRAWLGLAAAGFEAGQFESGAASLDRAAALMPPSAGAGIALQFMGAHCAADRAPGEAVYRRLETARTLGGDHFTVNALAWMGGAVASGRCRGLDRPRVARALRVLVPEPLDWDPPRARLRATHRQRLLDALGS